MRLGRRFLISAGLIASLLPIAGGARADVDPLTKPDGRLVVTLPVGTVRQLFTMNADGSDQVQLTSGPDPASGPTWSPDGTRIVFARAGDLWSVSADGGEPTLVYDSPAGLGAYDPSWSPDGSTVAFVLYSGPPAYTSDVYLVGSNGSGARELRPGSTEREYSPRWSPDGFVGFEVKRRQSEVWIADPSGGSSAPLTRRVGEEHAWGLSWRPDGRLSYQISTYYYGGDYGSQLREERATWTADGDGTRAYEWLLGPATGYGSWSSDSRCYAYSYGGDTSIDDESNTPPASVRIHCGGLQSVIDKAHEPDWRPGPVTTSDTAVVDRVVAGGNGVTTWSRGGLVPGQRYEIVARGTYSYGLAEGRADAECSNATAEDPAFTARRFPTLNLADDSLDLYVGGHQHDGWIPDAPDGAGCSLTHVYRLPFTAQNSDPISFQVRDVETSDNYGVLRIEIRRLS